MGESSNRRDQADHLFGVISSEKFLKKQGLGNEVPFFIFPHSATEGLSISADRANLIRRLRVNSVTVLDINLYELSIQILQERGILEKIFAKEEEAEKSEMLDLLRGVLDPQRHLIPKIRNAIAAEDHDVIFLSGVGEVYPYIRSHSILNNLQSTATDAPTVLFFPGRYTISVANGASLNLFGVLRDDKYYRAFNILDYAV